MVNKFGTHILSVQSHVSRDYVGNRGCALALQLLGHEVDVINTVNFSSMYVHQGPVLSREEFDTIICGLERAIVQPRGDGRVGAAALERVELTEHDVPLVMSGFIGDAGVLDSLGFFVEKLKGLSCDFKLAKDLKAFLGPVMKGSTLYLMDPVMGDNGGLYVSPDIAKACRRGLKLADIITPNEFELAWLTQPESETPTSFCAQVEGIGSLLQKITKCHELGPGGVFLTSCSAREVPSDSLLSIASFYLDGPDSLPLICLTVFPRLDVYIGGCGDVTSAVLADRLIKGSHNGSSIDSPVTRSQLFTNAIRDTLNTLQAILHDSCKSHQPSINVVKHSNLLAGSAEGLVRTVSIRCDLADFARVKAAVQTLI